MSRVGKLPVVILSDVQIELQGQTVIASGPYGKLSKTFKGNISLKVVDNKVIVTPLNKTKHTRAMWGTTRNIINNMVIGVKEGFTRELEVEGVGYRAALKGRYLNLSLGKSHSTKIEVPYDITVEVPKQNVIILKCPAKDRLGDFIAKVVKQRKTEPYKGKGIRLKGQYIHRKVGKKK